MLPAILVDPSALWLAHAGDTVESAENAITRALQWMKPNAIGPLQLYLSSRGVEALTDVNAFPAEPRFAEILKLLGLESVLNARTLAASVSRFLSTTPWIEDTVGLRDVAFQAIRVSPDLTMEISDAQLRKLSLETFGVAAICASEDKRHSLYAFPRQNMPHGSALVETKVGIMEVGAAHVRMEESVDRRIEVLGDPSVWPAALCPHETWRNAENPEEFELAIWLAAKTMSDKSGIGLKEFRVGTRFIECLRENSAAGKGPYAGSVLGKCAQTVLLQSSLEPKPFYVSAEAKAAIRQRARDRAKAWRLHVTKGHQALRLMYWELPDKQIEFATLGVKGEESIHDGDELPPRRW